MKTVLILGGYGNFGKRISENLAAIPDISIIIAGRSFAKANGMVKQLQISANATLEPLAVDIFSADFESVLAGLMPDIVIHTGGPYQGQGYGVPQACINVGAHYIDLADDRRFVCDITTLDQRAKNAMVSVVSGASSVPGLSSAVIDHYQSQFGTVESIDIAIAPGNKAERGEATVRAILSYTGHSFSVFSKGQWQDAFGWMNPRLNDFDGIVGKRWLANVDVPDLELFPQRYSVTGSVRFQAGLELSLLHLSLVGMAFATKVGLVRNWSGLTRTIIKASNLFMPFGTDKGGMEVIVSGIGPRGGEKMCKWSLYAPDGIGPYIPTLSAIIVARKLISGELINIGARPCTGLISLSDFDPYFDRLGIYYKEQLVG